MNKYIHSIRQLVTYLWCHQGNYALHVAVLLTMCVGAAALTQVPTLLAAQQATNDSNVTTTGTSQPALARMDSPANDPVIAANVAQPDEDIVPDPELCGENGYRIEGTELCTHGLDATPPDSDFEYAELALDNVTSPVATLCIGDGESGKRVQVLYVRASDKPDRYDESLEPIRITADNVSLLFDRSARLTGGVRYVNYVVTPECQTDVIHVEVGADDDDTFVATTRALNTLGYNRADRKYLIFMEADVYCGIATTINDSQPGPENKSNLKTGYARVDRKCWNVVAAAHELTHTLGGVQHSAPHSTGAWHCIDEKDVMCYSDAPYYPATTVNCDSEEFGSLLDCQHDDYYNANPAADNYLATHWNVADSQFLVNYDEFTSNFRIDFSAERNSLTPNAFQINYAITGTAGAQVIAVTDRVEFYVDNQLLGVTKNGFFQSSWGAPEPGTYVIEARLYGDGQNDGGKGGAYFQRLRVKVEESAIINHAVYLPTIRKN